jgi:4-hydroxy-3-methylbut-2-enyl diphosphate reductase
VKWSAAVKPPLKVLLAAPRGFCAGVERAIQIVERALEKYGPPVYVRHEIVHNRYVVERLEAMGARFVEELDAVPVGRPVIFSAHGVPKSVPAEAEQRTLLYFDATCPLVSKVHVEAERHYRAGHEILLIGHAGHPEVIGTLGQLPEGAIQLIETPEDAERFQPKDPNALAYITQTTLSLDEAAGIVKILRTRFPAIAGPRKNDICYATTNRQEAVKAIAHHCTGMLVIGSPNSSNSQRLVEVAKREGCRWAALVERAFMIDWSLFTPGETIGVTAGASAPEELVQEVLEAIGARYSLDIQQIEVRQEEVQFKLPRALTAA